MIYRVQKLDLPSACSVLLKQTCKSNCFGINPCQIRLITDDIDPHDIVKESVKKKVIKTKEEPKITLLDMHNNISVTTLSKVEKVALSQNLKVVRVVDSEIRSLRPVYKLMSESQYLNEELQEKKKLRENKEAMKSNSIKGDKLMALSVRINENDLTLKISKTLKWLNKQFEVRLVISGSADNSAPQEEIYKKFEKAIQGYGRIVQKRLKGGDLKFQILPPKPVATPENNVTKNENTKKGSEPTVEEG